MRDSLNTHTRFLFKELDIRGQYLSSSDVWQSMIESRGYCAQVRQSLGEITALAIILASGMKHKGKITVQLQGDGFINLLLAEVTDELKIRGMARSSSDINDNNALDKLLGEGQIIATLCNAQTDSSFQSVVPRNNKGLLKTFEDYFTQSEQLDSKLWVISNKDTLSAMLVQKMPASKSKDSEDWRRIIALADTITHQEMCELDMQTLLHRLFHEEVLAVFPDEDIYYECQKDRKRFENTVFNLGEAEARKLLQEHGEIAIHNEICNEHLFFNAEDVDKIFAQDSLE